MSLVLPVELSRSSQNRQMLVERNPDSPPRSTLTREKCSLHLPQERVTALTTATGNVKGEALPVYLAKKTHCQDI